MVSKSAETLLSAIKSAGEAALRLHADNEMLRTGAEATAREFFEADAALNELQKRYDALVAAAGKVTCQMCGGDGFFNVGNTTRRRTRCPDCADLRRLLGESHE
jgi:hypothetical protein